jgi:hypothetical protein
MTENSPGAETAEILVGRDLDDERRLLLVEAFAGLGVDADVKQERDHRGAAEASGMVLDVLPLHGVLSGLGAEAAKDFYATLKRVGTRKSGKETSGRSRFGRKPPEGRHAAEHKEKPVVLQDSVSGLRLELESDLPPRPISSCPAWIPAPAAGDGCTSTGRPAVGRPSSALWCSEPARCGRRQMRCARMTR